MKFVQGNTLDMVQLAGVNGESGSKCAGPESIIHAVQFLAFLDANSIVISKELGSPVRRWWKKWCYCFLLYENTEVIIIRTNQRLNSQSKLDCKIKNFRIFPPSRPRKRFPGKKINHRNKWSNQFIFLTITYLLHSQLKWVEPVHTGIHPLWMD